MLLECPIRKQDPGENFVPRECQEKVSTLQSNKRVGEATFFKWLWEIASIFFDDFLPRIWSRAFHYGIKLHLLQKRFNFKRFVLFFQHNKQIYLQNHEIKFIIGNIGYFPQ